MTHSKALRILRIVEKFRLDDLKRDLVEKANTLSIKVDEMFTIFNSLKKINKLNKREDLTPYQKTNLRYEILDDVLEVCKNNNYSYCLKRIFEYHDEIADYELVFYDLQDNSDYKYYISRQ